MNTKTLLLLASGASLALLAAVPAASAHVAVNAPATGCDGTLVDDVPFHAVVGTGCGDGTYACVGETVVGNVNVNVFTGQTCPVEE
jgi:hypothetical protein